ncbi:MAG: AAA-like domain-containing protein, partial [Thermodesulfobacteriota bacterium]|nr:AAA-like domain-containing protein [Thermodesulfobacteriota bacterium]
MWDNRFSTPKANCTQYFEKYLLAGQDSPLVLCLDQMDYILTYPQTEIVHGFLSLLRAWHEESKVNRRWATMRLAVLYSTEIYLPLQMNESPFNVGEAFELSEF